MIKVLTAGMLCAVSISSSAAFSHLNLNGPGTPVLSMNLVLLPDVTRYVDFQINGHDLGVEPVTASRNLFLDSNCIGKAIGDGIINSNQKNTFNFYECADANCTTKTLAPQTAYNIVIQQKAGLTVYTATPNVITVTIK